MRPFSTRITNLERATSGRWSTTTLDSAQANSWDGKLLPEGWTPECIRERPDSESASRRDPLRNPITVRGVRPMNARKESMR